MFLGLARDQESLRDVDLFFLRVAGELEDLHAVAERFWNRIHPVRRGHEEDLRQIERHIEIVIAERRVLFRVEHFHQRCRRIAAEIAAELVHLVQHEDGIHRFGALDTLDDLAGQSADVGAAVAADFSLVVHAAERNAHEFAAQRPGD